MAKYYELILYSTSEQAFASRIVDLIDRKHHKFAYRLYRQHCILGPGGRLLKSLQPICANRDDKDIIMVDSKMASLALCMENAVPIRPYVRDLKNDRELLLLGRYLKLLAQRRDEDDVRRKIREDLVSYLANQPDCN